MRPEGEIDFVASPNLTAQPYDEWTLLGRTVKVETAAEIVAKKLWHRGDSATARELFDLSLVIEREPQALVRAAPYLVRHREAFLTQIQQWRGAELAVQRHHPGAFVLSSGPFDPARLATLAHASRTRCCLCSWTRLEGPRPCPAPTITST
jgi:hypothetical protein